MNTKGPGDESDKERPFSFAELLRESVTFPGPTLREALLMHAMARIVLYPEITNIQGSWVKLGRSGLAMAVQTGVNDLGGVLMDESITRAASCGVNGQTMSPDDFRSMGAELGRQVAQRTTLYGPVSGSAKSWVSTWAAS